MEQVATDVSGHDLADVRGKLEAAQAELAVLRAAPVPAPDIRQRIEDYVRGLSRPTITGVGKGEKLKVIWPGAGWDIKGPIEHRAEVLPMTAFLFPSEMVAGLMGEVERMANDPMPPAARLRRIAELEQEIEQLAFVEEALVAVAIADREDVQRKPDTDR
jgi:hypothetical protein